MRSRTKWLLGGSILAIAYSYISDPNGGSLTATFLGDLTLPIIAVLFAFLARKALFDYIDMGKLYEKAKESTVGAGIVFLGICLVFFGLLGLFGNRVHAEPVNYYVPPSATKYLPTLRNEQLKYWSDHPKVIYSQV